MPATPAAVQVKQGKSHKVPLGKVGSCVGQPSEVFCLRGTSSFRCLVLQVREEHRKLFQERHPIPKSSRLALLLSGFR